MTQRYERAARSYDRRSNLLRTETDRLATMLQNVALHRLEREKRSEPHPRQSQPARIEGPEQDAAPGRTVGGSSRPKQTPVYVALATPTRSPSQSGAPSSAKKSRGSPSTRIEKAAQSGVLRATVVREAVGPETFSPPPPTRLARPAIRLKQPPPTQPPPVLNASGAPLHSLPRGNFNSSTWLPSSTRPSGSSGPIASRRTAGGGSPSFGGRSTPTRMMNESSRTVVLATPIGVVTAAASTRTPGRSPSTRFPIGSLEWAKQNAADIEAQYVARISPRRHSPRRELSPPRSAEIFAFSSPPPAGDSPGEPSSSAASELPLESSQPRSDVGVAEVPR